MAANIVWSTSLVAIMGVVLQDVAVLLTCCCTPLWLLEQWQGWRGNKTGQVAGETGQGVGGREAVRGVDLAAKVHAGSSPRCQQLPHPLSLFELAPAKLLVQI